MRVRARAWVWFRARVGRVRAGLLFSGSAMRSSSSPVLVAPG